MLKSIITNLIPDRIKKNVRYIKLRIKQHKRSKFSIDQKIRFVEKEYKKSTGKDINWNNPSTYTEKLNVSKLFNANKIKTKLTDKYLVRNWVASKIGEEYLIPLLGVYDSFDKISFNDLPNSFVMKCNHDSGSVYICSDKNKINMSEVRDSFNYFLSRNMAYEHFEMHYKDICPKIIVEKNMGSNINDYKFLCFSGKPFCCWVDTDRFSNHKRYIYDLEWKLMPFNQHTYNRNDVIIEKPKQFDKMIELATKLADGFDHVRVDFYDINGVIYFGEMTFTNGAGLEKIVPEEYDLELGNLWVLSKPSKF